MHQNTLVELYKAVEHGGLEQVKRIINSKQVDLSALNRHETNIVNLLFNTSTAKEKDEKLKILIRAGALPTIDPNNNFLMQAVLNIKDIAIRNEILTTVAQSHPDLRQYYSDAHVQAIYGVKPKNDLALATDAYGLCPIHYAISAGIATESWFEPKLYDITKAITEGCYQGINIAWWLLHVYRFDDFNRLTQGLSPDQCYEILKAALQNPESDNDGKSVAWLLLDDGRVAEFISLAQYLTANQRYEILKATAEHPRSNYKGVSVAWLLLNYDSYDVFNYLTRDFSPEQCYEILKAALQCPGDDDDGLSIAGFLTYERFDIFSRLAQGLTPARRYEILKMGMLNPEYENYGLSIAWRLLKKKRFDEFNLLAEGLTSEQYFEIFKSAPLNAAHDSYMRTVFVLLLNNKSYDLLLNFTKELKIAQLKELLFQPLYKKALNSNNVEQYSTVIKVMMESHADFAHKLFNQYTYEDLINWYNSIESDAIESQLIIHLCFSKLHEILHISFTNAPEVITEDHKDDIKKHLGDLFTYYQQILLQSPDDKEIVEKLGMLLAQSSETSYREIVIEYLEDSANKDYQEIKMKSVSSVNALKGYAQCLRIRGSTNSENARLLGAEYAQAKERASMLMEENKKLKEEIEALKQQPKSAKEKPSASRRTEKRPGFFADSLPVKKHKSEHASQPLDLTGGVQHR